MKLKQKLASGVRKGWTMMELIFVIVVMGLGIAAVVQIGTNAMGDAEIDSAVGKSSQSIVGGLPKYKFEYQASNGGYDSLSSNTIKTFVRPLTPNATPATYLSPNGYANIKYTFGNNAATDSTSSWVCMDASGKFPITNASELKSNGATMLAAQQKFVSNIKKLSSTIKFSQVSATYTDGGPQLDTVFTLTDLGDLVADGSKNVVCAGIIK